jgi:putative hydrolase of the HAD superfamily
MCSHLKQRGYRFSTDDFIANYRSVVTECRRIRYEDFREVNNCIWVADTLRRMGIDKDASNPDILTAVDKYFSLWQISIAPDARETLEELGERFEIALVSNFTHSAFLHRTLTKLDIKQFFDYIIDSDYLGWRKPHQNIFKELLKLSKATAEEAVFIGDDPETDIKGAKQMGIKAVLLITPFKPENKKIEAGFYPDFIVGSLTEFKDALFEGEI